MPSKSDAEIPSARGSSMLQFAVGFVIYTKLPWRETKTKNGLQALTKAKQRKEARSKSMSQCKQASSDGNIHKTKHTS